MSVFSLAVFDLVDRIAVAPGASEVWSIYLEATRVLGLRHGCLGFIPYDGSDAVHTLTSAMPKGWQDGYSRNELWEGDLVAARIRASTNSFEWQLSDWAQDKMSPIQRRWREHCVTFGIDSGLCVLDFHPGREIALSLCGKDSHLAPHDRLALCFAGHEAIHRLQEFTEDKPIGSIWLSQRERQCLEWAGAGKTDWEIGQILSLSEKTVNVYINRAKGKFSVKTRAQAILRASKAGLISV